MTSPIGLYLAEFTPGVPAVLMPPPDLLPGDGMLPMDGFSLDAEMPAFGETPPDFATDLPFGSDDESPMPLLLEGPADESATVDAFAPEPMASPSSDSLSEVIQALQADHAAGLEQAREQWTAQEGASLAAAFSERLTELETRIMDALAPILEPFLAKAAQLKVLDQLRQALGTILAGGDQKVITVTGPADLIEAIREAYPDQPSLAFSIADTPDVIVTTGDTRIRSQLRSWARKLDAALGTR